MCIIAGSKVSRGDTPSSMLEPELQDCRILIVEDEYIVAHSLEMLLRTAGAEIVGLVPSVEEALSVVKSGVRIDIATVDMNLRGQSAAPIVDALAERAVPFVFMTGADDNPLFSRYPDVPRCAKPTDFVRFIDVLLDALRARPRR